MVFLTVLCIFSGLQRLGGLSYFAGAEKKDEHVLVPDLGSLTSIYDRLVICTQDYHMKIMNGKYMLFTLNFNFP